MCCFRLHFSDFNVLFYPKNKKTCCSLLLIKITCCANREKKITCREEKSQPPWILNGPSLIVYVCMHSKSTTNDQHNAAYGYLCALAL